MFDLAEDKVRTRMAMAGLLIARDINTPSVQHTVEYIPTFASGAGSEGLIGIRRAVPWMSNAPPLEIVLVNASTPFRVHYTLDHPFQFPKTRRPILGSVHENGAETATRNAQDYLR